MIPVGVNPTTLWLFYIPEDWHKAGPDQADKIGSPRRWLPKLPQKYHWDHLPKPPVKRLQRKALGLAAHRAGQ
jgi:hypothetical protein